MQVSALAELTPAVDFLLPFPASHKINLAQALLSFEAGTASTANMDQNLLDGDPRTMRL